MEFKTCNSCSETNDFVIVIYCSYMLKTYWFFPLLQPMTLYATHISPTLRKKKKLKKLYSSAVVLSNTSCGAVVLLQPINFNCSKAKPSLRLFFLSCFQNRIAFMELQKQYRRYGEGPQGAVSPLTTACAPPSHFGLLKLLFLEHHVTARQQLLW